MIIHFPNYPNMGTCIAKIVKRNYDDVYEIVEVPKGGNLLAGDQYHLHTAKVLVNLKEGETYEDYPEVLL